MKSLRLINRNFIGGILVLVSRHLFKKVTRVIFPVLLRIAGIEYYHGSATKLTFYTGYHKGFKLVPVTLVGASDFYYINYIQEYATKAFDIS